MINSWDALNAFAPGHGIEPAKPENPGPKVFLKLVDGELKTITKNEMGVKENFLKFLGNFGFGPYYLGDIISKISKLFETSGVGENHDTAIRASKVLFGKVDRYNKRFLRVHIPQAQLDCLNKITAVAAQAAPLPTAAPLAPAPSPAPEPVHQPPSHEELQATLTAVLERIFNAETTEDLNVIEDEVDIYKSAYAGFLPEELLTDIDASIEIKRKFIANKFQNPRVLIEELRNIAITMIDEPAKGIAELKAFERLSPINKTTDTYALVEFHQLATRRMFPEAGETNQRTLDSLFMLIDEIDQAQDLHTLLDIEERLDRLSQKELSLELAKVPQATCDALFYARCILLEKKPKLEYEFKPFDPSAKGIIAVRGDGACLFRSFAIGLAHYQVPLENAEEAEKTAEKTNPNHDRYHSYLRNQVADFLEKNLNNPDVTPSLLVNTEDYNGYIDRAKTAELSFLPNLHKTVREKALQHIEKKYDTKIPETEMRGQSYLEHLKNPTFWGGDLELSFLSTLYNVNLQVYNREKVAGTKDTYEIKIGTHYPEPALKERPTICVLYNGEDHYDAYIPE